jgi:hypothetical protein
MNSERLNSHVRRLLLVFFSMILVAALLMWYLYEFRRVVICTDSLWNQAYLKSEKREMQLRINLLNRFYLPEKKVIPLKEATQEVIEASCSANNRAVYLLSPYLSSIINPQRLLEVNPRARFVLWESALSSENSLSKFESFGSKPRMYLLYIDHTKLANAFAAALKPLMLSASTDAQEAVDAQAGNTVQFYYSSQGTFRRSDIRSIKLRLEDEIAGIRVQLVDMGSSQARTVDAEIASDAIVLLAGGRGLELQPLLTKIENRGGRVVVFGDGALRGWPKGVEAEISIDLEASLLEVLERLPRLSGNREEFEEITTQNPAIQHLAVRFRITR